jgi:hypothetical protein
MSALELLRGLRGTTSQPTGGMKRICSNPLDRLCDKVLDIDFIETLSVKSSPTVLSSSSSSVANKPLTLLPLVYDNCLDYIRAWEPLLATEIREAMMSNFMGKVASRSVQEGLAQFSIPDVLTTNLTSIDIVFQPAFAHGKSNTSSNGTSSSSSNNTDDNETSPGST